MHLQNMKSITEPTIKLSVDLATFLIPERVACGVEASSKKRVLEQLSELIASSDANLTAGEVFDSMLARERLGGTGLGHGVAIPHGRLQHYPRTIGAFISLREGVDFDAIDRQPVDLLFALLIPEGSSEEHLEVLSLLASMFNDAAFRDKLRGAKDADAAYRLMLHWQSPD